LGLGIGLAVALLAARAVGNFVVVNVWDIATYALVGALSGCLQISVPAICPGGAR